MHTPNWQVILHTHQWHSQDEQVTWAQHGHTQCARINTHLLGDLGHTPAMKILHSEIASEAVFGHKYHSSDLPVCSLHFRMKLAITHAKLIFDHNFLHYFYLGTSKFNVGTGLGMPGYSYATDTHAHFPSTYMGKILGTRIATYQRQNYHFFWQLQHSCTLTAGYHHRTMLSTGLLHMVNGRRIHCKEMSVHELGLTYLLKNMVGL